MLLKAKSPASFREQGLENWLSLFLSGLLAMRPQSRQNNQARADQMSEDANVPGRAGRDVAVGANGMVCDGHRQRH
jgi:hypothetical protein